MEYFNSLDQMLQVFWYIAIGSSFVFIIQAIMTFVGMDASEGLDADFDSDFVGGDAEFQLFSFRNFVNFLLGFSWTGILFYDNFTNKNLLIGLGFVVGIIFVAMFFLIIKQILKLSEDNTFNIKDTLNQHGQVYINIPSQKSGKGKVQVSVKGSIHELDAITHGDAIASSTLVKVIEIIDNQLLVVEKL